MKIGQILIAGSKLSQQQLNFALYVQAIEKIKQGRQRRLGHILMDMDLINPKELANALGRQRSKDFNFVPKKIIKDRGVV